MTDDEVEAESAGVRSVQRAIDILALLTEQRPVVTVPEIVRDTGLAKTTVVRILRTLERTGMVWSTPSGLTAGPGLWRWAHLANKAWELPDGLRAAMTDVSRRTRETVNLYVRRDLYRVCIAQQQSSQTLRHVITVGDQLPLWAGASARVLLRDASDDLLERVAGVSPGGSRALPELRDGVSRATRDGFTVSHGEREVGVSAVAVSVLSAHDDVLAALTVSGPTARFTEERVAEFVRELQELSALMTQQSFSHPFGS